MSTTEKNPQGNVAISFDRIISDWLRYLGNLSDFFRVLVNKNTTDTLSDVFSRILPEIEQHRKRLVEFQHRSVAQTKGDREIIVSADEGKLLNVVSGHEWFNKSYWGKSMALRTVSRAESTRTALNAILLGVVYIHQISMSGSKGFKKWIRSFRSSMSAYLTEFIDDD